MAVYSSVDGAVERGGGVYRSADFFGPHDHAERSNDRHFVSHDTAPCGATIEHRPSRTAELCAIT
jgi:hypothetical protein